MRLPVVLPEARQQLAPCEAHGRVHRAGYTCLDGFDDEEAGVKEMARMRALEERVSGVHWVSRNQFYRLFPLPNSRDTPIQRRVKQARLRRCDVLALILYTGVFEYLCGCVPRERMQSLSLSTASCRFPSGQSMMIPAQANHYHPRALTTRTPPIFRADVHPLQRAPARLWLLRRGGGGHRVCIGRVLGAVERGRH